MLEKNPPPGLTEGSSFVTMAFSPGLSGCCPFLVGGSGWLGMEGFLMMKSVYIL